MAITDMILVQNLIIKELMCINLNILAHLTVFSQFPWTT